MAGMITVSRKEIEKLLTQLNITHQDIRALLEKAEVSEPVASYYGILDTGTVIDVNDTYDEANNKLQSLIKYAIDYKSAIIIPLYTSPQPSRIAELEAWANRPVTDNTQLIANMEAQITDLEAEIAKLTAFISSMI